MDHNSDNMEAEIGFQQVPVLQQNLGARQQQAGGAGGLQPPSSPYDEVELDALAEIERIEREAASEKCSKEVQDKGVYYFVFISWIQKKSFKFKLCLNMVSYILVYLYRQAPEEEETRLFSPGARSRGTRWTHRCPR